MRRGYGRQTKALRDESSRRAERAFRTGSRIIVDESAQRLARFFGASVELMQVLARACGHAHLNGLSANDLTTYKRDMAYLTGIAYGGVVAL